MPSPRVDWFALAAQGHINDAWRISRYILVDSRGFWSDAAPDSVSHVMCWYGPGMNYTQLAVLPDNSPLEQHRWWLKVGPYN